jgi:hypothetical protein
VHLIDSLAKERMLTADEALVRACNLAHDYSTRNMSPYALAVESGFREHRSVIDVEKIRQYVAAHPKLVGDWMGYSANKRDGSALYFSAHSIDGPYVVGGFPNIDPAKTEKKYLDGIEACAIYIKRELESIVS